MRGVLQVPDGELEPGGAHGHEGGEGFRAWWAAATGIWGAGDVDLFASGRIDPGAYRFHVLPGKYIVRVGFCELHVHAQGQRRFDVLVQGNVLADDLDLVATAGVGQSFTLAAAARVEDGEDLEVVFRERPDAAAPPLVNAIWVLPFVERDEPLPAPRGVRALGSYLMNVLFWDHLEAPDLSGYVVERRGPGDKGYSRIHDRPCPGRRWIDRDVVPGMQYSYRVRALDLEGKPGRAPAPVSAQPRPIEASSLPVYRVWADEADLHHMLLEVGEDRTIEAAFTPGPEADRYRYRAKLRLRGASSRNAAKKSYRIRFPSPDDCPLYSSGPRRTLRRVVYLKAEPIDPSLQQEMLTCQVFRLLGLPVSFSRFVNLFVNDRYQGVYLDIDPIDERTVERLGLNRGLVYRSGTFQDVASGPLSGNRGEYRKRYLNELLYQMNRIGTGEFASWARRAWDWDRLCGYLAASTVCHRSEIECDDFFYYLDLEEQRWSLVPWDHNNGNFGLGGPVREVGEPFMPLYGQTLQGIGHHHRYWYVLPSRIFCSEELREEYLARVEAMATDMLLSSAIKRLIERNHQVLRREILVDPFRWPPGDDGPFLRSADGLKRFAREHGRRLLAQVREERKRRAPPVGINEVALGSSSAWVELRNQSDAPVTLDRPFLASGERLEGRFDLPSPLRLEPGAVKVFEVPRARRVASRGDARPPGAGETDDVEVDEEARERRRLEAFGVAEDGGALALIRSFDRVDRARPGDDGGSDGGALSGRVLDWIVYGRIPPGFSYGERNGSLRYLEPTPGQPNDGARWFLPPPIMMNGEIRGRRNAPRLKVYALLTDYCPFEDPESILLRYRVGDGWKEAEATVVGGPAPRHVAGSRCAVAEIPTPPGVQELEYYFVARTRAGLERRAPLGAPAVSYRLRVKSEDD